MRLLSIDFGTSNTVVGLTVDGQAPRTITFDASPLLPSAVFLAADGSVTVGREAQRQARLDPSRYEPNPKRRIDDGEVLLGDRVVGVVDLIAAVLRSVATEVRRQLGGATPDEVRLTHPAQWGATRQNTLVSAARAAGLGNNLVLIPEPVAAAAQYTQLPGRALSPGGCVAVYDLGGGTFDIAVVGRTQNEFHVLAEAGLADLGGLDFDQAVLDQVGRTASPADPGKWQQILRPADASTRRAAKALAEDVRAAKETLSRYPQTEVALPDPFSDVHLTRPEFEGLIRPNLTRSIEVLQSTLRSAGIGPDRLTGIFLVGGSSRIPLVAKLIQDQLGVVPVALDQPETAVALGALLVPVHREGNRTVAFGDSSARPAAPSSGAPSSGAQPMLGPGSGRGPVSGRGPMPGTGPQPGTGPNHGARSGAQTAVPSSGPTPSGPGMTGAPDRSRGRSRTPILIAVTVVVLLVATAALLVTKPFSNTAAPPTTTSAPSTVPTTSGVPPTSSGPATDPDAPGVGPGKALTPGELEFLGPAASKLVNCGDNTASIHPVVDPPYRAPRVLRCEIPKSDDSRLYGKTLLFVFSENDPAGAAGLLKQITADRQKDADYTQQTKGGESETGAGTLSVVVCDHLSQLGTNTQDEGVAAVAWGLADQKYVGVMVGTDYGSATDLVEYFTLNYKPR